MVGDNTGEHSTVSMGVRNPKRYQSMTIRADDMSCFQSYGEIHMSGMEETVKFARVCALPKPAHWKHLLADRWNLKPPTLLISIIGSRAILSKRFKVTLKNGLWKAAESTGCWIISDGLDRGITTVAGEAVRDYTEAYGGDHIAMIGVAAFEKVLHSELFDDAMERCTGRGGQVMIRYPDKLSDDESDDLVPSTDHSSAVSDQPNRERIERNGNDEAEAPFTGERPSKPSDHPRRPRENKFRVSACNKFLVFVNSFEKESKAPRNLYLKTRITFERTILTWAKPTTDSSPASGNLKGTNSRSQPSALHNKKERTGVKGPTSFGTENIRLTRPSMALPTLVEGSFAPGVAQMSKLKDNISRLPLSNVVEGDGASPASSSASVAQTLQKPYTNAFASVDSQSEAADSVSRVPICGIVAGGGTSTIEHIYAAVTLNRCPMVIVRGSGGAADIISNVIDFMNFKDTIEENVISDEEIDLKIASIIYEARNASQPDRSETAKADKQRKRTMKNQGVLGKRADLSKAEVDRSKVDLTVHVEQVAMIRDLVEQNSHLLTVFDSDDTDLDGYMISALLSSAGMDTPRNELNLEQLEIAVRLNRADIARTKIFLEGKRWKKGALDDFMFTVILNDQHEFVSLLLENGFSLEEFLSVHTLERLYTECLKKTDYKTDLFEQLWRNARIYKMDWVMLRDIGRIIKKIMGDFYQPLYLTKKFRRTVAEKSAYEYSDEEEATEVGATGISVSPKESNPSSDMTSASTLTEEEADVGTVPGDKSRSCATEPRLSKYPLSNSKAKRSTAEATSRIQEKQKHNKSKTGSASLVTGESQPLIQSHLKVSDDEATDDSGTLKAESGESEDERISLTCPKYSAHQTTKQPVRNSYQTLATQLVPSITPTHPNGRRYIVRPITPFQLGYRPYVGYSNAVVNTVDLLTFTVDSSTENNSTRFSHKGTYKVIDPHKEFHRIEYAPPTAVEESTDDLRTAIPLSYDSPSIDTEKIKIEEPVPSSKPSIHVQRVVSLPNGLEVPTEKGRRLRGHAVFAEDPVVYPQRRGRSLGRLFSPSNSHKRNTVVSVSDTKGKRIRESIRVANSILHPLTDPEKAQLRLKEMERITRERQRDKQRRHRHRVAQGKLTIMERLTGKYKNEKLEELKPAELANFAQTATVMLERPAREVMLMCILLGKLTMAQVFWSQEKEPIAAALTASILFIELAGKADDVTCKEEYEEAARTFEDKADEVLTDCYQEDPLRTQLLLCRKLDSYGATSVIRLAARGKCIRFMAHPCCQELLSGIWMGGLSPKLTWIQLITGVLVGMSFPPLLPLVMKYTANLEDGGSDPVQNVADGTGVSMEMARKSLSEQASQMRYSLATKIPQVPPSKLNVHFTRISEFYRAPVTRFIYNTIVYQLFLIIFSGTLLQNLTLSFSYSELFLVLMVTSFLCEELKQAFGSDSSFMEYIGDGWNQLDCLAIGLFIIGFTLRLHAYRNILEISYSQELNLPSDLLSPKNSSSLEYLQQNRLISTPKLSSGNLSSWISQAGSLTEYPCGHHLSENLIFTGCHVWNTSFTGDGIQDVRNGNLPNVDMPYYVLTDDIFTIARIFYALSLLAFFVRLMYIFSFSMVLGPKLIMINRMVVHDLLPFLSILLVCQIGYGIAFQSIAFANGYYAYSNQSAMTLNSTFRSKTGIRSVYDVVVTSYFQMLGEFRISELEGESSACRDNNMCPQTSSRRLSTVMLSAFVLLTQVLMFNLLVATFTSTYNEIEGSSQYFWCYQRYEMIQEFVDRPSVAPPFMLLWYALEFANFTFKKAATAIFAQIYDESEDDDPFCRSLQSNAALERKLTKWEHMIGSRRTRADGEGAGARKWTGGIRADVHAIILRSGGSGAAGTGGKGIGGGTGAARGAGVDPSSILHEIGPIFGRGTEFIEDRFHELSNQLGRLATMEDKLSKMVTSANGLARVLRRLTEHQKQVMNLLCRKDGRRLVGRGERRDGSSRKNLILEAVSKAVVGLDSHCSDIEEKILEKIRIQEQCSKAVLTNAVLEQPETDVVLVPKKPPARGPRGIPVTGNIIERVIMSHRVWRIVPFNFESHPGIRMNVPQEKLSWKVPYQEYRTYKINEDRLAVPYEGMDDSLETQPGKLPYNTYDAVHGVNRACTRVRVRVMRTSDSPDDPLLGMPLNPAGRSGLSGRGLLPHFGPNHAIVVALTRSHPENLVLAGLPVIQVAALSRNQNFCLPWYLIDHRADCEFHECSANIVKALLTRRITALTKDPLEAKSILSSLKAANISLISAGFLHDHLNADHAWIEAVFLNIHESSEQLLPSVFLRTFLEDDKSEQAVWLDVCHQIGMRSSHDELLRRLAIHRKAFYHENLTAEEYG